MKFDSSSRKFLKAGAMEIRNVRCSDCSTCTVQCPNGVDVRNRLIRAQGLLAQGFNLFPT